MASFVLTIVDTQGIQPYIFGTNQLAQNVGASYLVKEATHQWVVDALPEPNNVQPGAFSIQLIDDLRIEDGQLQAEIVYLGGGNAVLLFRSEELARQFARNLTRRALREAPGLQAVLAHSEPFNWEEKALGGKNGLVDRTMKRLAQRKQGRPMNAPLLGMGVTASGVFTGLPATTYDKEGCLISSEAESKIEAAEEAHRVLREEFEWHGYEIPKDFDHFGRSEGERSYIAIVHADVNGMGKKVEIIRGEFRRPDQNRAYIQAMRAFSQSIKDASMDALQSVIEKLVVHISNSKDSKRIAGEPDNGLEVALYQEANRYWLPLRPIVYGGDDVTFITDGRLGLSLAAHYLRELAKRELQGLNIAMPIHARAGIAVAKTHFPFARAYTFTEELLNSAKRFIKEAGEEDFTAIDWHFMTGGMLSDLKALRERAYRAGGQKTLTMRPVSLVPHDGEWRTWRDFVSVTLEFQMGDVWKERRNKVKALRDVLRQGDTSAIEHFLSIYNIDSLPPLPSAPASELPKKGWVGNRTPYFDAIEAIDFFIPLGEEEAN